MRVLVTGANGFVGAALCKRLIENGDTVRGLVRKTSDLSLLEDVPVDLVVGSLNDPDSLGKAVRDIDIIYHVAAAVTDWGTLAFFRQVNVEGSRNILDAAVRAKVKRLVLVSSVAVQDFIGGQDMNEDTEKGPTPFPYCRSKREAEELALDYHRSGKIEVSIIRPGDVYGPGDRVSLLKMAKMLEKGQMMHIGGGKVLGAFTYVENLVDGLVLAGTHSKAPGDVFIITDGEKVTWRRYFETLTSELALPKPRLSINWRITWLLAVILETVHRLFKLKSRPLVTRYLVAHLRRDFHFSIDKAQKVLGYRPRVSFDEAIHRTAVWYRRVVRGKKE